MPKENKKKDKKSVAKKETQNNENKIEFELSDEIEEKANIILKHTLDSSKYKRIWMEDNIGSSSRFRKYINEIEPFDIENNYNSIILDPDMSKYKKNYFDYIVKSTQSLEDDTSKLRKERMELLQNLRETQEQAAQHREDKKKLEKAKKEAEKNINKLKKVNSEIQQKLALGNLISQVNDEARKKLFESENFRSLFESVSECESYVLSIDIRNMSMKMRHTIQEIKL